MLIDVQIGLLLTTWTLVITGALVWHEERLELRLTNPNSTTGHV